MIANLLRRGYGVQDGLGLGFETDLRARLTGPELQGAPLFAVGPLSCGAFWEIVAVPDIRQQAQAVAASLFEMFMPTTA